MFKEYQLSDLYKISSGLSKSADQFGFGYPFLSFSEVFWNYFIPEHLKQLVNSSTKEQITCSIKKGDVFLTRTSETIEELGMSSVALRDYPKATFNGFTKRLRPKSNNLVYPRYIGYYLRSPFFRAEITAYSTLTTRASLNNGIIERLKVTLPDLPTQKKIASILSAYDELIENNMQRIKLLEEMAEEIYKEWFVRLRFPGYQDAKFFDKNGNEVPYGTVGALPEGWDRTTLPNFIDFLEGPGLRNYQYTQSGIHYLNIRVMGANDLFLEKAGYLDTEEVNKRYPHFLLKENDHVVSSSGTIGRVVTIRKSHLPLCLNTSIIRMREKDNRFGTWLIKQYLRSQDFQGQISSFAIGAAQANFGPSHLTLMKATVPTLSIAYKFEALIGPMEEEIKVLLDKNQILQETRDLLLPRLISGKLNVEHINLEKTTTMAMAAEPEVEYKTESE